MLPFGSLATNLRPSSHAAKLIILFWISGRSNLVGFTCAQWNLARNGSGVSPREAVDAEEAYDGIGGGDVRNLDLERRQILLR